MEKQIQLISIRRLRILNGWFIWFLFFSTGLSAQFSSTLTGTVLDAEQGNPVPFATITIMKKMGSDTNLVSGTIADEQGVFKVKCEEKGRYLLQITSVGFHLQIKEVDIFDKDTINIGSIILKKANLRISEAVVTAKRIRGKTIGDKTVYFIHEKARKASGSAADLLRHIPGISVDLKQNVSLQGKLDILLYVDGKERDRSYISQLNPSDIERVEVLDSPSASYGADVAGVINIVLKKNRKTGFSGHVFSEIPTSKSVVYSFPTASLSYSSKNWNAYTSYKGEINLENIEEISERSIHAPGMLMNIFSIQQIRQKNFSHTFHYGADYSVTPKDVVGIYGFYNPYSYEQDGRIVFQDSDNQSHNLHLQKEETDHNRNIHHAVFYKHQFNDSGTELTCDVGYSGVRSENVTVYAPETERYAESWTNSSKPQQIIKRGKIDFKAPLGERIVTSIGLNVQHQTMRNENPSDFSYKQQVQAFYGMLGFTESKVEGSFGLRAEKSKLKGVHNQSELNLFPHALLHFKLNKQQHVKLSYRRSIKRPSVYSLDPYNYVDDPTSIRKGNPLLEAELTNRLLLEHSFRFQGNHLATRCFYETKSNAISNLTILNDSFAFEQQVNNLGTIMQYGVQFLGSFRFGPLSFNPSLRFYEHLFDGNRMAELVGLKKGGQLVLESGLSAVLSFKHDLALAVFFQHKTHKKSFQETTFSDALYFISLDKTFKKNLKVGIMSALPFSKTFVYQGTKISSEQFTSRYAGNLKLPTIPIMFRISYQLTAGKNLAKIDRSTMEVPKRIKSGL